MRRESTAPDSPGARGRQQQRIRPQLSPTLRVELRLKALCMAARILPAVTAENAATERTRMIEALARGEAPVPDWEVRPRRVVAGAFRLIDDLRREAREVLGSPLYLAKLDELELELLLIDALGRPKLVKPLSARRYGTAETLAPTPGGPRSLAQCARRILSCLPPQDEPRQVAADGEPDSLATLVRRLSADVQLDVSVVVEPRLAAGAATGERTVYIADRRFGRVEAVRLAIHEVLGHLVSAANGRAQPMRLLEWGTAGSFVDQEGVALYLEEHFGVMDAPRLRTLAGRVLATDLLHSGATFAEAARRLHREEGFCAPEAIAIAERAYRGGGVARDHGYLLGWLRVHHALATGKATLDELRCGRVSAGAIPVIRALMREGYARPSPSRPNFLRSLCSTPLGTTPCKSPPSDAASLIRLELTKK